QRSRAGSEPPVMMSVSVRLLIAWTLFAVLGTLAPFDFTGIPQENPFNLFQYNANELGPVHFALNLIFFMPLAALLHHEATRRQSNRRSTLILTTSAALILSLTVEYLQRYLPSRDSSLIDVLANTSGGVLGFFLDRAWGETVQTFVERLRAG